MKKGKPGIDGVHDEQHLFAPTVLSHHRRLILPRYLEEEAFRLSARREEIEAAHAIFLRWADLESKGQLDHRETALDDSFRQEIFVQALRYGSATTNPTAYGYQKGFFIPATGTPDGVLGHFPPVQLNTIRAVIELKDAAADLDHDKFNGRTPVQQAWDYLVNLPDCPWAMVSNFVSFRLYHRDHTQRAFEHFTLQQLRSFERFVGFWAIFERDGLLNRPPIKNGRAAELLERSANQQREIGDKLYDYYSEQRILLIQELVARHGKSPEQALRCAQKLLDRVIFIAFCEDRGLLPSKLLEGTWKSVPPLARAGARWRNFLDVFYFVDKGHEKLDLTTGYNGGLFAPDPEIDQLDLSDRWPEVFKNIGEYDFAEDVNVDVLGRLFEKSVSEIEKLRTAGAFFTAKSSPAPAAPAMPKSAERKRFGIYYTPPEFTAFIVRQTVGAVIEERFAALAQQHAIDPEPSPRIKPSPAYAAYWQACLDALRQLTVVDPACGSGAFLIAAYELLEEQYQTLIAHLSRHSGQPASTWAASIPHYILNENLYGVDLSKEAVEITQTALWIRSARKGRRLDDLSGNILCGNSLVTDSSAHPRAMDWKKTFPRIFDRPGGGGFDCVIGNPPWERLNLKNREFFAFSAPEILEANSASEQRKIIKEFEKTRPELFQQYLSAQEQAEKTIAYVRSSGNYPLTARGDINTYMVFAELARKIVAPHGRVGLLVPSGIATDDTTKAFFNELMESQALICLYDFENKEGIFADVHRSFKFSALVFGGSATQTPQADFAFFLRNMRQLADKQRHISLSAKDLRLLNPNTRTCPIFRTRRDAELTKAIYRRVPILIDENRQAGGNPWGISYMLMFHQSFDADRFRTAEELLKDGYKLVRNCFAKRKHSYLPLYEAKMLQAFDHRAAGVHVDKKNWMRQGQTVETTLVEHQNPEFTVQPRWWIEESEVARVLKSHDPRKVIAFKNVTSPTNQRTMIACFVPPAGVVHSAPIILTGEAITIRRTCCLLANLNSLAYDYITRQKIGGINLSYYIINQIPTFPPDAYDDPCPWDKKQKLEKWISDRVLKLTCTAEDMAPLAQAGGFKEDVHKWKESERADLRAELDAAYFHLYGIGREEARYILSTFQGMTDGEGESLTPTSAASRILEVYNALMSVGGK